MVICPYTHVSEGLNLQNEFDSIIWVEMAQSHFLRDQASRRIWRLGKQFDPAIPEEQREVRVYYLVYTGTAAHKKLHKLRLQSGAALLFSGDTPDGALVEQAGAHRTALAQLSRGLEEDDAEAVGQAELQSAFAQRNDERYAALQRGRAWVGVVDTLPERLARLRAGVQVVEVAPEPEPELVALAPVPALEPEPVVPAPARPAWGSTPAPAGRPSRTRRPVAPSAGQLTLW